MSASLVLLIVSCCVPSIATAANPLTETVDGIGGYQLYVPFVKDGEKAPLLVWLHPAGGEGNDLVTRWWPEFHELGYALMLPKSKSPRFWELDEDKTILAYIDHAAKTRGIDPTKVVLLGYSVGGQMAFYIAAKHPGRVAGVVTMSAAPVKNMNDLSAPVPPAEYKDKLAYFMAVGEKETRLVEISRRGQLEFLAEGFSAVLHVVKDAGHEFHRTEKDNIFAWLKEVKAGVRPAEAEVRELAETAADQVKAERERRKELEQSRQKQAAVAIRVFDTVKENIGAEYALEWREAGQVEQGGAVKIFLPDGWKLGDVASNGDSSAVPLTPPGERHIVAYLGRSVKEEGVTEHYRSWFEKMRRENGMAAGKSGALEIGGRRWQLHTFVLVPYQKVNDPLARRVLVMALLPVGRDGTEWRSLTVMCPEQDCDDNRLAELVRGILEKLDITATP